MFIGKDGILIKMLHNLGMDIVFENLATNCCEGDGTVVGCFVVDNAYFFFKSN